MGEDSWQAWDNYYKTSSHFSSPLWCQAGRATIPGRGWPRFLAWPKASACCSSSTRPQPCLPLPPSLGPSCSGIEQESYGIGPGSNPTLPLAYLPSLSLIILVCKMGVNPKEILRRESDISPWPLARLQRQLS